MWNPCLDCGACCAFFRASFYWSEADSTAGGLTPPHLTTQLTPHHAVMRGTEITPPRCVALHGEIGKSVKCVIHALRPSPCRDFPASWVDGVHNERCDRARAAHGLPPLVPPPAEASAVVPATASLAPIEVEAKVTGPCDAPNPAAALAS